MALPNTKRPHVVQLFDQFANTPLSISVCRIICEGVIKTPCTESCKTSCMESCKITCMEICKTSCIVSCKGTCVSGCGCEYGGHEVQIT